MSEIAERNGEAGAGAVAVCKRCNGTGEVWRVPSGFNPFSAGGWNTIKAMYRAPCHCRGSAALSNEAQQ